MIVEDAAFALMDEEHDIPELNADRVDTDDLQAFGEWSSDDGVHIEHDSVDYYSDDVLVDDSNDYLDVGAAREELRVPGLPMTRRW